MARKHEAHEENPADYGIWAPLAAFIISFIATDRALGGPQNGGMVKALGGCLLFFLMLGVSCSFCGTLGSTVSVGGALGGLLLLGALVIVIFAAGILKTPPKV